MTTCWFFGHRWIRRKKLIVERPLHNMTRVFVEDRYWIYQCHYCKYTVRTPENYRQDNTRREKWETISDLLKGIFR